MVYSTSFIPVALIEFSTTASTSFSTALHSIEAVRGFSFEFSSRQVVSFVPDLFFFTALILASKSVNFSSFFASICFLYSRDSCSCSFVSSPNVFIDSCKEFREFWVYSLAFVDYLREGIRHFVHVDFDSLHFEFHPGHCLFEF